MSLLILITLLTIWSETTIQKEVNLPELLTNLPDKDYFVKYGPCSISTSRLQDAYFVEGKLATAIIKGLNNVEKKKNNPVHAESDEELKKEMNFIIAERSLENAVSNFTNNPINALNFLMRIVIHFNPILNKIFTSKELMKRHFHKDLSVIVDRFIREESSCWPTPHDLILIVRSISRISSTYSLPKKTLMEEYIKEEPSFKPLSVDQAVALAHESNRNNYYNDVLDWTGFLLKNIDILNAKSSLMWQSLVKIRAGAFFKNNDIEAAISLLSETIEDANFDTKVLKRDLRFYQTNKEVTKSEATKEKYENHTDLCQRTTKDYKDIGLRCYYRQIGTFWDRVKVEIVSQNPPAFKYYRIIKDEDVLFLSNLVKNMRIKMSAHNDKSSIISDKKNSREIAVVWDEDHIITKHLSQKISYLTGLEVKTYKYKTQLSSSSPFQIINYGIGGFIEPHTDYLALNDEDERKNISDFGGDRMATWMYQLSDKVQGGQIVFIKSNITVTLEKGSGILVFNIFKNGTINPSSAYMECPVLLGSKWIGTKYIHENGNMFKRKCPRRKKSFFGTLF